MDTHAFRSRALGAVIGSAVGDALGAPFEFGGAGEYSGRFPTRVVGGRGEMIGGGPWAPGDFTDDTQMAIAQGESLLTFGAINSDDLFERFRVWSLRAADVGIQTRSVLNSHLPWTEAAADHFRRNPKRAAGNGSLMRATPSAVFYARQTLADSTAAARELSAVTHGDPATGWGTALFHAMIHIALNGGDPITDLPALLQMLPSDQHRYREMLSPAWRLDSPGVGNGSVWGCLAQAVWAVRTTNSFEGAVVAAIDLGGDTDTVAAVAGGLAGAIYGIQKIPSRWTSYLHGSVNTQDGIRHYRLPDLQQLALALIGEHVPAEVSPGRPAGPTEICDRVFAANLAGASSTPDDWAVLSLCRVGERFIDHPARREIYLVDKGTGQNQSLGSVVLDAVDSIDAFVTEGRAIVVHCHAGASRTGLILRAWLMRRNGLSVEEATSFVAERWPLLDSTTNASFADFLRNEWSTSCASAAGQL